MIKNSIVKVAKNLIRQGHKEELIGLLKVCKKENIDISEDIERDYKEKYEGSKVLMITLKVKEYNTSDKYVDNYIRCYIEIDNMVSEGIEVMQTIQAREEAYSDFPDKIIDTIIALKKDLLREIIEDCIEEDIDPKKMLSQFDLVYHYADKDTEDFIAEAKDKIEENLSKEDFIEMKEEILKEYQEFEEDFAKIEKNFKADEGEEDEG